MLAAHLAGLHRPVDRTEIKNGVGAFRIVVVSVEQPEDSLIIDWQEDRQEGLDDTQHLEQTGKGLKPRMIEFSGALVTFFQ